MVVVQEHLSFEVNYDLSIIAAVSPTFLAILRCMNGVKGGDWIACTAIGEKDLYGIDDIINS